MCCVDAFLKKRNSTKYTYKYFTNIDTCIYYSYAGNTEYTYFKTSN